MKPDHLEQVISYLSRYLELDDDLIEFIKASAFIQHYPKGTVLLREGELANRTYFVLSGCIKSYAIRNGEEVILDFFTEEYTVNPLEYNTGKSASHFLECIENTVVTLATPEMEQTGFEANPAFEKLCRIMSEQMMNKQQTSFAFYKLTSPEERYIHLQENRPDLLQRVPQYQIASLLGIKPESLSRIRKRLAKSTS